MGGIRKCFLLKEVVFRKSIDSGLRKNCGTYFEVKEISKKVIFLIQMRYQQLEWREDIVSQH